MSAMTECHPQIAILDFGSQYSHLIARRVRELNVFCELYSCLISSSAFAEKNVIGIILSGGPASVYEEDAPHVHESIWKFIEQRELPVLGICYGMQELAYKFGGEVLPSKDREFGSANVEIYFEHKEVADLLFARVETSQMWMSHGDKVTKLPLGFIPIAHSPNSEHAAIAHPSKNFFGLQFHPEVTHSLDGKELLFNFVIKVCRAEPGWNMRFIADEIVEKVSMKIPTFYIVKCVLKYYYTF